LSEHAEDLAFTHREVYAVDGTIRAKGLHEPMGIHREHRIRRGRCGPDHLGADAR